VQDDTFQSDAFEVPAMVVLAPQQNRTAGEHLSNAVVAPPRAPNFATHFRATIALDPAALADPTLVIDLAVEGTIDGVNWITVINGQGWVGGRTGKDGAPVPPRVGWMAPDNRILTHCRVRWTQNKATMSGASISFSEIDVTRGLV
jgi:hypothetical protein